MISARELPARDYLALKEQSQQLLEVCKGTRNAATHTRVGHQHLSKCASVEEEHEENFLPIDVLADLEAVGGPIVTQKLAELNGCLLVPLPRGRGHGALTERSQRTAQEFAEMMASILAALADGRITPAEGKHLLTDIHELMLELAGLAEEVKAAVEDDPEDRR